MKISGFSIKKSGLIHPFLFAIFPGLFFYSHNIEILSLQGLLIPLLVITLFAFSLWLALRFIFRNGRKAGLIVSLFMILFLLPGHILDLVLENFPSEDLTKILLGSALYLALAVTLVLLGLVVYYLIRTKRKLDNATLLANVIGISLIAIVFMNIGAYNIEYYFFEENNKITENLKPLSINNQTLPDIYYILLDGYHNQIILKENYGYDNQKFINNLNERGFVVPSKYTHTNYPKTYQTIPSLLNMDYIDNLVLNRGSDKQMTQILYKRIDNNAVMRNLNSIGYTTFNLDSGFWGTRHIDIADENLCSNLIIDWNLFEKLKATTMLPVFKIIDIPLREAIIDSKRQQTYCELSELPKIKDMIDGPVFVFAHFLLPHGFHVFDSNGPVKQYVPFKSKTFEGQKQGYIGQLEFINKKILESIDELLTKTDNPPIIIIQSDHGERIVNEARTGDERAIIEMGNFNAFYVPDDMRDLLSEPITPVNTFRLIFNSVFNSSYEILDDKVFISWKEAKNWKNIEDVIIKQFLNKSTSL